MYNFLGLISFLFSPLNYSDPSPGTKVKVTEAGVGLSTLPQPVPVPVCSANACPANPSPRPSVQGYRGGPGRQDSSQTEATAGTGLLRVSVGTARPQRIRSGAAALEEAGCAVRFRGCEMSCGDTAMVAGFRVGWVHHWNLAHQVWPSAEYTEDPRNTLKKQRPGDRCPTRLSFLLDTCPPRAVALLEPHQAQSWTRNILSPELFGMFGFI